MLRQHEERAKQCIALLKAPSLLSYGAYSVTRYSNKGLAINTMLAYAYSVTMHTFSGELNMCG